MEMERKKVSHTSTSADQKLRGVDATSSTKSSNDSKPLPKLDKPATLEKLQTSKNPNS